MAQGAVAEDGQDLGEGSMTNRRFDAAAVSQCIALTQDKRRCRCNAEFQFKGLPLCRRHYDIAIRDKELPLAVTWRLKK